LERKPLTPRSESIMSRSGFSVCVPLKKGTYTAILPSSARGVGGAEIKGDNIVFQAGPSYPGDHGVQRKVLVQGVRKMVPNGYKDAGGVVNGKSRLKVLVEFPR
jgi:hypothetical protein